MKMRISRVIIAVIRLRRRQVKRRQLWTRIGVGHRPVLGYVFGDGILGAHSETGDWMIHHIPTGLSLGTSFEFLREAKEFAIRIREIDALNWYCTDGNDFGNLGVNGFRWLREVGNGKLSVEEFNKNMMVQKMGV